MKPRPEPPTRKHCLSPRRHLASALLLLLLPGQPRSARAQSPALAVAEASAAQKETARALVLEGRALAAAKDYPAALERHMAAYRLVRVPTVGMEVARTQEAMGKWVEANATAVEIINLPTAPHQPQVFADARQRARELLTRLTAAIPSLRIEITPAGVANVRVEIDGEPANVPGQPLWFKLNPGGHELLVSAPGHLTARSTIALRQRDQQTLTITLVPEQPLREPAPATDELFGSTPIASDQEPSDATQPALGTLGYVALGTAGVAALVGGVTGTLAFSRMPDCPEQRCRADQRDDAAASLRYGDIATVSFGVALAAGAYGLWELLSNGSAQSTPSRESQARAQVTPLSSGAVLELTGTF